MYDSFAIKLSKFSKLTADDRAILASISEQRIRRVGARQDIVRQGERPTDAVLLLTGWASSYKMLEDGRRQITSFMLPGDLSDVRQTLVSAMDYSIGALTPVSYVELPLSWFEQVIKSHPRIMRALQWQSIVQSSIQREWVLNIGQRNAFERISHLLCELYLRLDLIGRNFGGACEFPITQVDIADATGLTPVHVNRTLQELRSMKLIVLKGRQLEVTDLASLQRASFFTSDYLHLDRPGGDLDENYGRAAIAAKL